MPDSSKQSAGSFGWLRKFICAFLLLIAGVLVGPLLEKLPIVGDILRKDAEAAWRHQGQRKVIDSMQLGGAEIVVDGNPVKDIYLQIVRIANTGDKPLGKLEVVFHLASSDEQPSILGKPIHSIIEEPNLLVSAGEISEDRRKEIMGPLDTSGKAISLPLEFKGLNPGQEIQTSIITDRRVEIKVQSPIQKGISFIHFDKIEKRELERNELWQKIKNILLWILIVAFIFFVIFLLGIADQGEESKKENSGKAKKMEDL